MSSIFFSQKILHRERNSIDGINWQCMVPCARNECYKEMKGQSILVVYHKDIDVKMGCYIATHPTQDGRDASIHALHNNERSSTAGRTCNYLSNDGRCLFYKVVRKVEEMPLWTPGEIPKIKVKGNKLVECNVDILEVPGGQLHADILSSITDIGR